MGYVRVSIMVKVVIFIVFVAPISVSRADDSLWVYRLDSRNPSQIFYGNGFPAWGENENIVQHISGDSIIDESSIYVATTSDLDAIRTMARLLLDLNPDNAYWVYYIRPGYTFYNLGDSLVRNAAVAESQESFDRYMSLYYHYQWQSEVVARGGIDPDQIYAARPVMRQLDGGVWFGPITINVDYDGHTPAVINNNTLPAEIHGIEEVLFEEGASSFRPISLAFSPDCERSAALKLKRSRTLRVRQACQHYSTTIDTFLRRTKARNGLLTILQSDIGNRKQYGDDKKIRNRKQHRATK